MFRIERIGKGGFTGCKSRVKTPYPLVVATKEAGNLYHCSPVNFTMERQEHSIQEPQNLTKGEMDNRFILLLVPIERSQSVTEVISDWDKKITLYRNKSAPSVGRILTNQLSIECAKVRDEIVQRIDTIGLQDRL